jgi:hypothetical protein
MRGPKENMRTQRVLETQVPGSEPAPGTSQELVDSALVATIPLGTHSPDLRSEASEPILSGRSDQAGVIRP